MNAQEVLEKLRASANAQNVAGMARFGINPTNTLGVSMVEIRALARGLHDHALALELWASGIHEARILASLVDVPREVTEEQAEAWVLDLDSWDTCDQLCINLLRRTPFAQAKALAWSEREETFVKRAGFVLMATLAVHDKKAPDAVFMTFLPLVEREAADDRNFVKKAVNWALRQIGKRNAGLCQAAMQSAERLKASPSASARWVGSDALRELSGYVPSSPKRRAEFGAGDPLP